MKNALKITFAYLAAVIGAGFASGSEAVYYFVRFGKISFIGIVGAALGFGLLAFLTVEICRKNNIHDFYALTDNIMPHRFGTLIRIVSDIFMLIILGAMICAFAQMSALLFGIPTRFCAAAFSLLCLAVLCSPEKAIINLSGSLGIYIVMFLCVMCIYMINHRCTDVFSQSAKSIFSSASYTSYNFVSACPLLCTASLDIKSKRQSVLIGIMSCAFSFLALFLIWTIISVYYGKIPLGELPMLTLASRQGYFFCLLYASVMAVSILTTAIASAFGASKSSTLSFLPKSARPVITVAAGFIISSVGFSSIVSRLYNLAGICTIVLPMSLLIKFAINADK